MPIDATLQVALRQAQFLGDKAFGVVPYGTGFGIRVKSEHFQEVLTHINPEKKDQFVGAKLEISGLPLAMGKESLQDFLGAWQIHPLHTFRQGFRRTWIVRASVEPTEKLIAHDYGLAVIKEAVQRRGPLPTERFQAPRTDRPAVFVREKDANYPKSWAGIVAGSQPQSNTVQKESRHDRTVSASVASTTVAPVAPAQASAAQIPVEASVSVPISAHPQAFQVDLANMMAAAIEAALKPMKERLEATIVPMQRTLEGLQAEFVALRTEEKDGDAVMAADAKRMRMGSDQ